MAQPDQTATVTLGNSDVHVRPVGIGAWAWGDRFYWGGYVADDLAQAYQMAMSGGVNFIDTAEVYGMGNSEKFIGAFLRRESSKPTIATKFFPYPWRVAKGQLINALKGSLKRLGISQVELYQLHWPVPPMLIDTWVNALANAVEMGLTKLVGVSNYSVEQTKRAYEILNKRGIHLASNQVHYSLLSRNPETSGLLKLCKELDITLIAYSPIEQGILTGKYTPSNPPSGVRARRYPHDYLIKVQPLVEMLREIGQGHGGKTPSQVAINWVVAKGAIPIPGARNRRQAEEIAGTLGWRLSSEEVAALDQTSESISLNRSKTVLESWTT